MNNVSDSFLIGSGLDKGTKLVEIGRFGEVMLVFGLVKIHGVK